MNRRNFLQGILAAGVAPAFVRSESLMLLVPRQKEVITLSEEALMQIITEIKPTSNFARILWPGLIQQYKLIYDEHLRNYE